MPKTLQEVQGLLDELYDLQGQAEADPQGAGRRLRQQIINRANDLSSSTGDFAPMAPAHSSREVVEQYVYERKQIKDEASEVRHWAINNLPA
jgi:hypothetical protein